MERVSVLLMMTQSGNIRISKTINTGTKEQLNSPGQGTHPPARGGLMRSLQCKDTAQMEFQPWWEII